MRKLGRKKQYRMSMMRNLTTSLILYEQLETTMAKGKELKNIFDKVIVRSKKADLNAIRYLNSVLFDKNAVEKAMKELVPRYKDRKSGFTKIFKIKQRIGDNATIVRVELVDKKVYVEDKKDKQEKAPASEKNTDKVDKTAEKEGKK